MAVRAEPLVTDKCTDIPDCDLRPTASDPRFWRDRIGYLTVFLAPGANPLPTRTWEEIPGIHYFDTSSLAHSMTYVAHSAAQEAARQEAGSNNSVVFFQAYAARILGRSAVDIQHILSGVDLEDSGEPHQLLGIAP